MAKTILIVEDEPSLLSMLSKTVSGLGYTVVKATDGEEALSALKAKTIDLMLLDIILPKINGLKVLQEVRVKMNSKVPVIILSNLEKTEDVEAGRAYGVTDYLTKSHISMRELSTKISHALKSE